MRTLNNSITLLFALLAPVVMSSCGEGDRRHHIGVSQCSQDIWRDKLNAELRTGTYLYDDVQLSFACADDNDQRQIEQIDSFVKAGVDLLIVAPNQMTSVAAAIDRAYDAGIPVIVFDRKTDSQKFTAYIGADNYEMGRQMGLYIAKALHGRGRVMEVMGLKNSSPAIDRHRGFTDAMRQHPGITVVASLQGDWTEASAVKAVEDYRGDLSNIDFVFGQNDRMAVGARKALLGDNHSPLLGRVVGGEAPKFCGIDALPGEGGGIALVRDSILAASYIYPTRGDLVMQLAMNILGGQPYEHENLMQSAIVTPDNAEVMLMQADEMTVQGRLLQRLHGRVDWYLMQYRHQQVYIFLLAVIVVMVLGGSWYARRSMQRRHDLEREAFAMVVEKPIQQQPTGEVSDEQNDSPFLEKLRQYVQDGMSDSEFGVETLSERMNLSRTQLYRKVKVLTGRTPVDIIRQSRLNRAKHLLETTDKNVSEVAYAVGFSAPSYFTKCFREEFGVNPTELMNGQAKEVMN